jgi:hypothetical protein
MYINLRLRPLGHQNTTKYTLHYISTAFLLTAYGFQGLQNVKILLTVPDLPFLDPATFNDFLANSVAGGLRFACEGNLEVLTRSDMGRRLAELDGLRPELRQLGEQHSGQVIGDDALMEQGDEPAADGYDEGESSGDEDVDLSELTAAHAATVRRYEPILKGKIQFGCSESKRGVVADEM